MIALLDETFPGLSVSYSYIGDRYVGSCGTAPAEMECCDVNAH